MGGAEQQPVATRGAGALGCVRAAGRGGAQLQSCLAGAGGMRCSCGSPGQAGRVHEATEPWSLGRPGAGSMRERFALVAGATRAALQAWRTDWQVCEETTNVVALVLVSSTPQGAGGV